MKTIIINDQRELAELPELWFADFTNEAAEYAKANRSHIFGSCNLQYIANPKTGLSVQSTYITPSEFMRLVYEPWKESQKVELPDNYCSLLLQLEGNQKATVHEKYVFPNHINACIQLTNIMNFANDAFEGNGHNWTIKSGAPSCLGGNDHPIRFTSQAAAEWAYKTFPEIFKAYWNA